MDIERFSKVLSGERLLKKCGTRVDRLSQLPDHIIVHILSFLPLKKAAATSVLSTRWLDLWKYTPKLNFVEYNRIIPERELLDCKYINWVNSVLDSYNSCSLQEFTIAFLVNKSNQYQVTRWLEFAFLRRVERMEWIYEYRVLTEEDDVVHEEILNALTIQTSDYQSLKVLVLKRFTMSGHTVEFFLRNCRLLERLVLDHLIMTSDLDVVGGSLKHLEINSRYNKSSIKVCAPNLIWLTIDHASSRVFLENVPKLVNMHLFCRKGDTMHDFAKVAAQLETLIMTLYYPTTESFSFPEMPKLKKLVVYYRSAHENTRIPITCLIQASPCLEEFRLEISELLVNRVLFEIPKGGPLLSQRHLKRFVFSGYRGGGCCDRIELVKYIVNNCIALEEIVIGQCDCFGVVRDLVDYCVPLEKYFFPSHYPVNGYLVPTEERLQAIDKSIPLLQIPAHIKLCVV